MAAFPLIALHLRCCLGTAKVVKHRDVILRIRALAGEIIADHDAIHAAGECHGLQASKIQLTPAGVRICAFGRTKRNIANERRISKGERRSLCSYGVPGIGFSTLSGTASICIFFR